MHLKKNNEKLEKLISKLDEDRAWLLKNIDKGKWPELRMEIAQLEREICAERVSLGVRDAIKKRGTWGGRKTNLTPQVKNKVVELRSRGVGIRKIATKLKIGVGTTYDILKSERKVA